MHPILAGGARIAMYFSFWLLTGVLLAAVLASQAELTVAESLLVTLPLATMYAFVCLSAWYVARSMPLGGTGGVRIAATATTASLASSAAWALLARVWTRLLHWSGAAEAAATAGGVYALLFGFGVLLYLLSIAGSYLLVTFERSRDAERRGLEGQVLAREAELRSLRAQIDPHFLFNSLHSISALTTVDPQAARRMTVLLGDFLRESLAVGAQSRITLGQELRLAERFLEVERVRFGDRLQVAIDAGGAEPYLVPPLLLQPIVENAVTHGVAHMIDGGLVRIAASATPLSVRIAVENPCDPDRPRRTGTGVGLANVRARLRALHGDDARVSATEGDGLWRVEVMLPRVGGEGARVTVSHE
jgi:two-component system, LytTR family, sensor histidine kinase AlgZ